MSRFDEPDFATTLWTDSSAKYAFTFSGLINFGVIVRRYAILPDERGTTRQNIKGDGNGYDLITGEEFYEATARDLKG